MRTIVTLAIVILICLSLNSMADPVSDVKTSLERLKARFAASGNKREAGLKEAADIQRIIQLYISSADQNDWATPSEERLRRLGEVATAIQPYSSLLVDLGTPSETEQGNQNALNLLYFARPTIELKQGLMQLANVPNPRGAAHGAYDIIFNLGMGTTDVREGILKRMPEYSEDSYKSNAAAEVFYAAAAEWRMPEAVPFYIELLNRDSRNKEQLNTRVRAVATAVRPLGQEAATVLPLLQEHVIRMKAENVDHQTIGVIEGAIRAVEGKEPIEPLLSVTGAGPVSEGGIRRGDSLTPKASTPTTPTTARPVPTATPVFSAALATPVAQSPTPKIEQSAPVWPWLVGIAALTAIALLVWKRRG